MSTNLSEQPDSIDQFHRQFEWKGKTLYPFSEGRKAITQAVCPCMKGGGEASIVDAHILLFIGLHGYKVLSVGQIRPADLIERVLEWADSNITPADYEAEAVLVKEIIDHAFATKATTVADPGAEPTAPGN
jgi:hypothetical protein